MKNIPSPIAGLLYLASSCILFLSLISYDPADLSLVAYPANSSYTNLIGIVGAYLSFASMFLFGKGSFFFPFYLLLAGISKFGLVRFYGIAKGRWVRLISSLLLISFLCAFVGIFAQTQEAVYVSSGLIGYVLSVFFHKYFNFWGSFILLGSFMLLLSWFVAGYFFADVFFAIKNGLICLMSAMSTFMGRKPVIREEPKPKLSALAKVKKRIHDLPAKIKHTKPEIKVYTPKQTMHASFEKAKSDAARVDSSSRIKSKKEPIAETSGKTFDPARFKKPTIDILKVPPAPDNRQIKEDIEESIVNIEDTLADFGVKAKVVSVQKGPVVTMYELLPSSGVKIQKITALTDDIALAMKSANVRIVAPLPGKGTIGIEIPNITKHLVFLREVLEEKAFINAGSKLTLGIGKDVKGDAVVANLKEMPHLLIAGTTGSGKTVCVNSIIASIFFKAKPNEVKFILIDPKKVELAPFGAIPYLLHPIISEAKKAFAALNWAVEEMEARYKRLAAEGVRNIDIYNRKEFRMPHIVIVVDELADLMIVARDKIETAIQRLAQLSRAVGIHLILATQRPSVDVITGVIKANFPARISFKVSSKVDSRTVLDMMGADKLLGKGDCLFISPGTLKPIRAQGSFIDDEDIENLTAFLRAQGAPVYETAIAEAQQKTESRLERDEMLDEAVKVVLMTRQASASLLQRRLRVGYTRAARLLDLMEEEGIIGPFCGSKAREILVDPQSYLKEKNYV